MIDLDKLEAAAKAATKGRRSIEFIESDRHWLFANNVYLGAIDLRRADAEFMAHTDPGDILDLIAELRRLRGEVWERPLCESRRVVLRIGQGYRFVPDPDCESCMQMKREHDEAYREIGG